MRETLRRIELIGTRRDLRRNGWWGLANRGSMKLGPDNSATVDSKVDPQLCRWKGGYHFKVTHKNSVLMESLDGEKVKVIALGACG